MRTLITLLVILERKKINYWNIFKYFCVFKNLHRLVLLKHIVNATDISLDLVQKDHRIGIVPNSRKSFNFIEIKWTI